MSNKFITRFFDDEKKYFNLITFFSWILKREDFASIIHDMSKEIGFGDEYVGCYFSNIFENRDEEGYFEEGVAFYCGHNEGGDLIVDYSVYVRSVELAYSIYCEGNGADDEIERDIALMHKKYGV